MIVHFGKIHSTKKKVTLFIFKQFPFAFYFVHFGMWISLEVTFDVVIKKILPHYVTLSFLIEYLFKTSWISTDSFYYLS